VHFWVATIGIVLYIAAMWIAGVMQGLMWRAVNEDGTLTYTFVESVKRHLSRSTRCACSAACCSWRHVHHGWNVWKTIAGASPT
jgi:cytochrome c oxidase cbb3-type subunit I